ncbi:MAG: hypothetical protein ABDH37_02375 [Candidatus Hydrothermales bacterium]
MLIKRKTNYAIKTLVFLSYNKNQFVDLLEISKSNLTYPFYITEIFQKLKKEVKMELKRISLFGDSFPKIKVIKAFGAFDLPYSFKGKWFVLFSHPADFTPVCTPTFLDFKFSFNNLI